MTVAGNPLLPLFGITFQLNVVGLGLPPFTIDNTLGDSALVEWSLDLRMGSTPQHAQITIYNLDPFLRLGLSLARKAELPIGVTLLLGWGGFLELAFNGKLWKLEAARVERTDTVTTLDVAVGLIEARDQPPAGGVDFGAVMSVLVARAVVKLGYIPNLIAEGIIAERAAKRQILAFKKAAGKTDKAFLDDVCAAVDLDWGVDPLTNQFVVFAGGLRNDVLPAILDPGHGLLTWSELDDGGVELEALTQPRLVPGAQITVLNEQNVIQGGGPLRIESVQTQGSSETTSVSRITARKLELVTGADIITGASPRV